MNFHSFAASKFSPTDLQSAPDETGEYSHATTLLTEASRRIREREREIVRHALGGVTGTPKPPTETEALGFLGVLIKSLGTGPDALTPFSAQARVRLGQHFGTDPEMLRGWELFLHNLARISPTSLPLGDHLLLQRRAEQTLDILARHDASLRLAAHTSTAVNTVVDAVQRCQNREVASGAEGLDPWMNLRTGLEGFLNGFGQWLRHGSEAEVHLNLCRYWGEQIAPGFEMSLVEWGFLFAALENAVSGPLGPLRHRALVPFFITLERAAAYMAFAGAFYRHFPEIEKAVDPQANRLPFDWRDCVRELMGEILWNDPAIGSPLAWRLAWGEPALGEVDAADFRRLALGVVNASRPLGERHWLDLLERAFQDVAGALEHARRHADARATVTRAVRATASNLREGCDAFRQDGFFEEDLQFLFDGASACAHSGRDAQAARRRFRGWFAGVFFLRHNHDVWRNAATITGALRTTLRRAEGNGTGVDEGAGLTGELLAEAATLQGEAETLRRACAEMDGSLRAGASFSEPGAEAWRRLAVEMFRVGTRRAPLVTLDWLIGPAGPAKDDLALEECAVELGAPETTPATGGLAEPVFRAARARLVARLPGAVAGRRLWNSAEGIGAEASRRVYAALPSYLEKTGSEGMRACARDLTLTLRRVSLALRPEVSDPAEFIGEWWDGLIAAYLKNRPTRLFEVTGEELCAAAATAVSPAAAAVLGELIGPLYLAAARTCTPPPRRVLANAWIPSLDLRLPLWEATRQRPEFGVSREEAALNAFFREAVGQAIADPDMTRHRAVLGRQKEGIARELAGGAVAFAWGGLSARTTAWWHSLATTLGNEDAALGALLYRLPRQIVRPSVEGLAAALPLLAYLDELAGFHARCLGGLALESKAPTLAARVHDRLDAGGWSLPVLEGFFHETGVAWSRLPAEGAALQACRLCVEVLAQIPAHSAGDAAALRRVWQTAAEEVVFLLPGEPCREVQDGLAELARLPQELLGIAAVVRRKFRDEADPIFDPDPVVEARWRELVELLPVLASMEDVPSARHHAARLRLELCESLPLLSHADFGDHFACIGDALKGWFPELRLGPVIATVAEFDRVHRSWKCLHRSLTDLPALATHLTARVPALAGGADQAGQLLILTGLTGLATDKSAAGRTIPAFLPGRLAGDLLGLSAADLNHWRTTLSGVLAQCGTGLEAAVAPAFAVLAQLREKYAALEALWWRDWTVTPRPARRGLFGFAAGAKPDGRETHALPDGRETVLRLALDSLGLSLTDVLPDTAAWYNARVLPASIGTPLEAQTAYLENLAGLVATEPAAKALGLPVPLGEFSQDMPRRVAVYRLSLHQQFIVEQLADALGRNLPAMRRAIGTNGQKEVMKDRLARDCIIPLRGLCRESCRSGDSWGEDWSTQPLAFTWQCSQPVFHQAVRKLGVAMVSGDAAMPNPVTK